MCLNDFDFVYSGLMSLPSGLPPLPNLPNLPNLNLPLSLAGISGLPPITAGTHTKTILQLTLTKKRPLKLGSCSSLKG